MRRHRIVALAAAGAVTLGLGGAAFAPAQAFDNPFDTQCVTNCYPLPKLPVPLPTGSTSETRSTQPPGGGCHVSVQEFVNGRPLVQCLY